MPCPASDGAAETANGAMWLMRMVLLGLTGAYYTISAAITVRTKSNPFIAFASIILLAIASLY